MVAGLPKLTYEEPLQRLALPSLEQRRMRGDLILAFNIFNGNVNLPFAEFFIPAPDRSLRGHDRKLYPRHFRLNRRKATFSVCIAAPWNKLPQDVIRLPTTPLFKEALDNCGDYV
ncbi:uncharacterized protein LOC106876222 [Octopus bimaculoides]|uniref:uncharacterized protein LOC106876222 n=1 Tax=Octopus bimaculoides TaxID=37653 RepID=UPI00071CDD00|nr:uncharacterized protein LOC106876222 [Octopus bimaculoides]|eukprot:XP_014780182.1 PREDICTED: uncharacterized protein LOC106876222 [Octopus bimaculoides]